MRTNWSTPSRSSMPASSRYTPSSSKTVAWSPPAAACTRNASTASRWERGRSATRSHRPPTPTRYSPPRSSRPTVDRNTSHGRSVSASTTTDLATGGEQRAHSAITCRSAHGMEQFVAIGVRAGLHDDDAVGSFEVVAERFGTGDRARFVGPREELVDEVAPAGAAPSRRGPTAGRAPSPARWRRARWRPSRRRQPSRPGR